MFNFYLKIKGDHIHVEDIVEEVDRVAAATAGVGKCVSKSNLKLNLEWSEKGRDLVRKYDCFWL